jgi:hypothetical protein
LTPGQFGARGQAAVGDGVSAEGTDPDRGHDRCDLVELSGYRLGEFRGPANSAAEHDQLRVDDGDDRADRLGHQPRLFGHDRLGALVAGRGGFEDAARGDRTAHTSSTRGPDDARGRGRRLKCPALARLVLVGARAAGQRHERDLPGHTVRAAQQLAADDEAHADARADMHEGEVVDLPAVAQSAFGQGGGVHVVLHHQRWPERLPQPGQRRRAVPAAQPASEFHGVAARIVDAGTADHGLSDGRTGHARVLAQQTGQLDQFGDPGPDAGGVGSQRGPGPDLAGQVSDRAADVLVPEVQAEHEPGVGPDLVQPGRATGHAGPLSRDADQASPLHVVQGQGHGGLGQAGDTGQLGPRAGTALADVLHQQLLVHRPDQRGTRREQARSGPLRRWQSRCRCCRGQRVVGRDCGHACRQGSHGHLLDD